MSNKQNALDALNLKAPASVPLWELHFHLWDSYTNKKTIFGHDYNALPEAKKDDALKLDAEIITEVSEKLGFGAVSIPDMPWDCPYVLPEDARLKLIENLRALNPDFLVGGGNSCCLAMPDSYEYIEFSYLMYDEPEQIDERAEKMLSNGLEELKRMADAGAEFVYLPSDLADTRAPYFNDEQLERFFIPYAEKWVSRVKELSLIPIFHTDGNIMPIMDKILTFGMSGIQALDPIAGITIKDARKITDGKICLCGNVDCGVMLQGSPDDVYKLTEDIIHQGKGSPFILGNSNAVVLQTPKENYDAFINAWNDNK